MKILLLLEATLGGTARHILDLAEGLLVDGHEVHLLYSSLRADNAFLKGLASPRGSFFSKELPIRREVGVHDIPIYFGLARYARQHGPFDILHSHSTKAGFLLRLIPRAKGSVSIYTPHGLMTQNPELLGPSRWAVCALEATLSRLCDHVIAVSRAEENCAIASGIPSGKISVISNGLSPIRAPRESRNAVRTRLSITDGTVCIGSVGLLVPNKEQARLVDAFALVKERTRTQVLLLIVGWGSEEPHLRHRVQSLGLADSVGFLGQVPAVEYYPAFDIFAHSSRYEGFAYTFLEALRAGLPIVTTRVGGAEETVRPGVNGAICDPWDTDRFASELLNLVEDSNLRATMGQAGRERSAEFTADKMVSETLALYHGLRSHMNPLVKLPEALASRIPQ